jgi:hypothetical protein
MHLVCTCPGMSSSAGTRPRKLNFGAQTRSMREYEDTHSKKQKNVDKRMWTPTKDVENNGCPRRRLVES